MMKKYPFWVIKSDAKRLLRGKWNPLVLSLFIPFLLFSVLDVTFFAKLSEMPPTPKKQEYLVYAQLIMLAFFVLEKLLTVGIYENLKPSREKASFFSVYAVSVKKIWKMLPTLFISIILPSVITYWLTSQESIRFYDYLMFSIVDYHVYLRCLQILWLATQIASVYLQYSLMLVPAITVEHPKYGGLRLIKEGFMVAKGSRFYLFSLSLSFVGWIMLGSLALTIGILWAMLYMYTANYAYYRRMTIPQEPITITVIDS